MPLPESTLAVPPHAVPSGRKSSWPEPEPLMPLAKYDAGWRRVVRNFTPSWFSVIMGTGIVGVLLHNMPYGAHELYYPSIVFFALNALLFGLALGISILRYTLYPECWGVMVRDPVNSLFLGTVPMGLATLIQMWTLVCVPAWGPWAVTFVWGVWIIDAVVAVAVAVMLPFLLMSTNYIKSLERITAVQLLPVAAMVVAGGVGARVAEVLPHPQRAFGTLVASYILWGMGLPLALVILVIYYQRLAVHKLPPREAIASCCLPLGPLGFGGFGILYLGKVAQKVFPLVGAVDPMAGQFAYLFGFFLSLIMWAFGLVWLFFALATVLQSGRFPFNMGWWGFVFPLGVYAASTVLLGQEFPSRFFRVLGMIFNCCVILLWFVVAAGTVKGVWTGKLFHAPCLANLKPKPLDEEDVLSKEA
ncbi:C4-dicarboxylate transporter/malic acid transport protein [Trichodelitschia bisporula]|uniref:Sulfite efflux pump SSU1 n=1 Tax=Trichodelitschia bisporula TaxID=703511 RepID=A0A6G1I1F5_9PEZI|nr:C4-dicarboxylate transporter/malic acid transport protein [Trichodelitschia bisporula]